MRFVALLLLATACGGRTSRDERTVRDVQLEGAAIDLDDWDAWSVSPDGKLIVVAPGFRRDHAVVIDVASGACESRDGVLLPADSPLFRLHGTPQLWDEAAQRGFATPPEDFSKLDYEGFRNDGAGRLVRLARFGNARLTLQVWDRQEAVSWSKEFLPAPDTAGVAISPSGDVVAMVEASAERAMTVTAYDTRNGTRRWSVAASVRPNGSPFLNQRIEFSDDGALIWINGLQVGSNDGMLESLYVSDGAKASSVPIDRTMPNVDGDTNAGDAAFIGAYLWTATVRHARPVRRHGGPPVEDHWVCEYTLYRLGRPSPVVWTSVRADDRRAVFGSADRDNCTARAMRPLRGGAVMAVRTHGSGLRITTWKLPPGAQSE